MHIFDDYYQITCEHQGEYVREAISTLADWVHVPYFQSSLFGSRSPQHEESSHPSLLPSPSPPHPTTPHHTHTHRHAHISLFTNLLLDWRKTSQTVCGFTPLFPSRSF